MLKTKKEYIIIPADLSVSAAKHIGLGRVACKGRGNKKYFTSKKEAETYILYNMSPSGRYKVILHKHKKIRMQ